MLLVEGLTGPLGDLRLFTNKLLPSQTRWHMFMSLNHESILENLTGFRGYEKLAGKARKGTESGAVHANASVWREESLVDKGCRSPSASILPRVFSLILLLFVCSAQQSFRGRCRSARRVNECPVSIDFWRGACLLVGSFGERELQKRRIDRTQKKGRRPSRKFDGQPQRLLSRTCPEIDKAHTKRPLSGNLQTDGTRVPVLGTLDEKVCKQNDCRFFMRENLFRSLFSKVWKKPQPSIWINFLISEFPKTGLEKKRSWWRTGNVWHFPFAIQ